MSSSTNLQQLLLTESGAANYVSANQFFTWLDALCGGVVDKDLAAQPGSPGEGDLYILPASPTGSSWAARSANDLALHVNSSWSYVTPKEGMTLWVNDENTHYVYDGSAWVLLGAALGSSTPQAYGA